MTVFSITGVIFPVRIGVRAKGFKVSIASSCTIVMIPIITFITTNATIIILVEGFVTVVTVFFNTIDTFPIFIFIYTMRTNLRFR